jgi:hypothetical protein
VGLNVDDAGCDDEAAGVDPAPGWRVGEHAGRSHPGDAVADDADVAVEPGVAGAIDDLPAGDHDVVRSRAPGIRGGGADGRRAGTGGEGDERGAEREKEFHGGENGMRGRGRQRS